MRWSPSRVTDATPGTQLRSPKFRILAHTSSADRPIVVSALAFAGGMTLSAIKRDRGVKDYGELIPGHGGVLDRIDSLCFAAPVFFHAVRWYFGI